MSTKFGCFHTVYENKKTCGRVFAHLRPIQQITNATTCHAVALRYPEHTSRSKSEYSEASQAWIDSVREIMQIREWRLAASGTNCPNEPAMCTYMTDSTGMHSKYPRMRHRLIQPRGTPPKRRDGGGVWARTGLGATFIT